MGIKLRQQVVVAGDIGIEEFVEPPACTFKTLE
jgi:hypothetical protein